MLACRQDVKHMPTFNQIDNMCSKFKADYSTEKDLKATDAIDHRNIYAAAEIGRVQLPCSMDCALDMCYLFLRIKVRNQVDCK